MNQQLTAANRKDVRQAEKQAEIDERNRGVMMQRIMADGPGRKWLWDLLGTCAIWDGAFYDDNNLLQFRQGQRTVGLRILADVIKYCPELYIQAQREANERASTDTQLTANAIERSTDAYADELAADLSAARAEADSYRHPSAEA